MDNLLPPGDRLPGVMSLDHHHHAPINTLPSTSVSAAGTASSSPTIYYPDRDTELGNEHIQTTPTAPPPGAGLAVEPYSKGFWARGDEAVHRARVIYFKAFLGGLLLVILAIFSVFSIYWGSLWKVPAHTLQGWIIDFDGGDVGQFMVQALTGTRSVIAWQVLPASEFPQGVVDVVARMKNDESWAAITINQGASRAVQNSLAQPDPTYNASLAITAFGVEARNENAYRNFIRPIMQTSLDVAKFRYAYNLAGNISSNASINLQNLLQVSPQTLISPVSYTIVNLIPFNQPVASAVVFVGLIYLLILSFFIVMIAHGAREASGINRLLQLRSLIMLRLLSSCFAYFMLSLFYSLLNLAFQLDMTRKYGRGGFMAFWMLNWIGMLSVGLALESLITLLTPRFIPFFMILWIICNVSVCIFPIDILPRIYHYGYAAPFYNISNSIRSIAFGTKNTLGLNFGVLFAWVAISFITLPIIQWYVRRSEVKALSNRRTTTMAATIAEKRQPRS